MSLTIELPDNFAALLRSEWGEAELSRKAREALAVEAYRQEIISRGHVSELLGMNFWETEAFLKEHGAYLDYDEADLEEDRRSLDRILGERK